MAAVTPTHVHQRSGSPPARIDWLDGVRACAAMYVVLHHAFLATFTGFPRNTGPWYLGWLLYGQLGVAVFIVVSGFSLMLGPLRHGGVLREGWTGFYRRRAWRILPPYWAALVLAFLVQIPLLGWPFGVTETIKSVVVHAALLQDVLGSPSPNGAFWSIAIEAQIYLVFPALLVLLRWRGAVWLAVAGLVAGSAAHGLAVAVPSLRRLDDFVPQLFVLFVFGMAAAAARAPRRRLPVVAVPAALAVVAGLAMWRLGSVTVITHYFAVDVAVGAVVALAFYGMRHAIRSGLRSALCARPLVAVGHFSYSVYLMHAPVLSVLWVYAVRPLRLPPTAAFGVLLAMAVPAVLVVSYGFFRVFEVPFLTVRSWAGLRAYVGRRFPVGLSRSPRPRDSAPHATSALVMPGLPEQDVA